MEVSLWRALLQNISSFLSSSSRDGFDSEPVRKSYQNVEEIVKLLKPILDATMDTEVASDDLLNKALEELGQSMDELRDLFESWHPLLSRVDLVLQAELLTARIQNYVLEFFWLLKDSQQSLPVELGSSSLEHCIHKVKNIGCVSTSTIIDDAMKDQAGGHGPTPEQLVKIADCLGLKSNQEILIEAVALEMLKENAEQAEKNAEVDYFEQLISIVTRMHDRLVSLKQSQGNTPVPIPADFCCPLSLELMTDPVIVSSGQTYERAFIRKWLDLGLTVCPKTRQSLAHTNLIPNYTVKALIANWCEINNVKIPDPLKSIKEDQPLALLSQNDSGSVRDSHLRSRSRGNLPVSPELTCLAVSDGKNLSYSGDLYREGASPSHPRSSSDNSKFRTSEKEHGLDIGKLSLADRPSNSEGRGVDSNGQYSVSPGRREFANSVGSREQSSERHNGTSLNGNRISENLAHRSSQDADQISQSPGDSRDASGELSEEPHATAPESTSPREPEFPTRLMDNRSRSQNIWRRPADRLVARMVSSPTMETRPDLLETEVEVKKLVEDLKSDSVEIQREATAQLRLLAKHNMDNRIVIAGCGAIRLLVDLLQSTDSKTQENAVTALLNLSINDNNKLAIANADAIEPLIHALQTGTPEARENSAATLFSLSVIEENKSKIGRSGAIGPLVELLGNGTPRGKKDAATALFNLSIYHENKIRIVQAGAVRHLVELMDPAAGMVDKAVAVLANLATIHEGRTAIGQAGGIPVLVEVVELGSARGKENAAAALLQLCTFSARYCNIVLQEGAVPPLVALSQSGTARAREKAQSLLSYFRSQRHANSRG
ncbi:U-box domain-containing protein 4-like [Amaranthus tricolor]|uniref:U-box domain-containing protein 4-like n=1 Tax=Amaranthus tricolor TaxID=29722 RepID=UPI00258D141B|nr:U-box domain-containing protein 4-like [Amaranthus tricolor]XP_057537942.1 U-box domain-containing protein 4-like [Amaranthus tricolor]